MNLERLYEILAETTVPYRRGPVRTERQVGAVVVTTLQVMPHESEAPPELEKVDLTLLVVGVRRDAAERRRGEVLDILRHYPDPDRLIQGPSYIEVGGEIGDQGAALRLFALGKVLGLWKVVTPALLGFDDDEAPEMAGAGFVLMAGYRPG